MNPYLQIRTLSLVSGLVSFVLALILVYAAIRSKTYKGFRSWTRAYLLNSFGIIAISLQGALHPIITISTANLAMILYLILLHLGFRRFFDLESKKWVPVYVASLVIHTLWYLYFTYVVPSVTMRMSVGFIFYTSYALDCMRQVMKYSKRVVPQRQLLFMGMFGIVALWLMVVVISTFVSREDVQHYADTGLISAITLIVNLLVNILGAFGMILINSQRLHIEFTQSHKKVEELSGLIPICAHCKKIRDDSGYWDHLEGYFADHTNLSLSHSICPDCMEKHYSHVKGLDERL